MGCAPSSNTVQAINPAQNGNVPKNNASPPQGNDQLETSKENQPGQGDQPQQQDSSSQRQPETVEEPVNSSKPELSPKETEPIQQAVEPVKEPEKSVQEELTKELEQTKPTEAGPEAVANKGGTAEKQAPVYTEESLQAFLVLQKKLGNLEKKNITGQYQAQHKMLVSLYGNLQAAQKKVEELRKQTLKEYQDVEYMQHPNVRAMFANVCQQRQLQSQIAKEQEEYMVALNKQEVAEKELKGIQQEYNALYAEVDTLRKDYEQLEVLRKEQEKTLDEIFGGKYGSELEEQLEVETDLLNERKEMITTTRNRWYNAKVLTHHAVGQLEYSIRRWAQIYTANYQDQIIYAMVAETRNYLIAASQNIANAHRYISNVNIPYCNSGDLTILNTSISSIFHDVATRMSHNRALQTYNSLYHKASNLLQWIDMVLEKTINKDLEKIVPECNAKLVELRRERIRLIQVKLKELQGKDITDDDIVVDEEEPEAAVDERVSDTHIAQPDTVSLKEDAEKQDVAPSPPTEETTKATSSETESHPPKSTGDGEGSETAAVVSPEKPKPLTELAPVPAQDILFGNIEELKVKYEQQVAEFSKAQDVNKARVDQALEDKLRARRSRRKNLELQQVEASELAKGLSGAVGSN